MLDRKKAPPYLHSNQLHLPHPKITHIADGLSIYHLEEINQGVNKIEVVIEAGKWVEPFPGISHFTCQMLDKGTNTMTSADIAAFFDQHGAFFESNSGTDYISLSLYSLSHNLEKVLPVFLEIIGAPTFPKEELEVEKSIFLQSLEIKQKKTSYLASKALNKNIFGLNHPYGKSIEEEHVHTIGVQDLEQFHQRNFSPHSIFIVGKVSNVAIERLSNSFSAMNKKEAATNFDNSVKDPFRDEIKMKEGTQATIRMGKKSIMRNHADYFDLLFLNHLLGGFFGSRLMKNIREEKGLTYGISSSLHSFKHGSVFLIGADINRDKINLVFDEVKNELLKLSTTPIPLNELALAKNHFIGNMQIELASPFSVMEKIKKIQLLKLSQDYYQELINKVESFNETTQLKIASKYFDIDSFYESVAS